MGIKEIGEKIRENGRINMSLAYFHDPSAFDGRISAGDFFWFAVFPQIALTGLNRLLPWYIAIAITLVFTLCLYFIMAGLNYVTWPWEE